MEELMRKRDAQMMHQFEEDLRRRSELHGQERERIKARRRGLSDATVRPTFEGVMETFERDIEAYDSSFRSVRLYHGREGSYQYA